MRKSFRSVFGLVSRAAATVFFISVVIFLAPIARAHEAVGKLNGGYYLLYNVSNDESQLPMIFLIKHDPSDLKPFADRISKIAKETVSSLDRMKDHDDSLQFDQNPLPQIEQDVRDSIRADKQHELLFGTTNAAFGRALLIDQIEASNYALNICKVLADQETDPDRAKTLRHLSARWLTVRVEAFHRLQD